MDRSEIKKILEFGYNKDSVFGFANAGFNLDTLNKNIVILKEIGDNMLEVKDVLSDDEIHKLILRLGKAWKEGKEPGEVEISFIEIKSIGYGMEKDIPLEFVYYLHHVSERSEHWTPSCLKGYLHTTLKFWHEFAPAVREANTKFIAGHADEAGEEIKLILPFITPDGPSTLGHTLRKNRKSYNVATATMMMPVTRLNYTYFEDTIISYFRNVRNEDFQELLTALNLHNQTRTDKILIPSLINKSSSLNKGLLEISQKRIGDPFDEAKYAPFDGATPEQADELKRARKTLLGWIMQEIIRLFFEVLCNDNDRKAFWAKQAHKIKDFTVFGSTNSRQLAFGALPSTSVQKHFNLVESTVDNCALAMYIGDYVIIEFTQVGALYAYKVGSDYYRQAFRYARALSKIDDLKVPQMSLLYNMDTQRFSREGKMDHRGINWRGRMERWMNHIIKYEDV